MQICRFPVLLRFFIFRSEKAQMVLPLAKPVPLGLKYSYNVKRSHMVPERNAGVEFHAEMFNSRDSIFPKSLYSRLSWILGPYHFDVFEVVLITCYYLRLSHHKCCLSLKHTARTGEVPGNAYLRNSAQVRMAVKVSIIETVAAFVNLTYTLICAA